nr:immunoglobulin light chain junction region [Macaca mulatta]MOW15988.1 immunoglobulin light chain junction region [Macaca mulatta]MOW16722.1 immunoglobulin light chain junction region [Macaca mulatta]MOW17351.1 immunoglobulin light chain junction region [Macaca mulatta]MOW17396.1 immunoglobulin light chain junction region [Macaca mulatta]
EYYCWLFYSGADVF